MLTVLVVSAVPNAIGPEIPGSQTEKLKRLNRVLDEIQKRTDRLYEAVEKGLLSLDFSLMQRAHKPGARQQAILTEIAGIKREQEIPLKVIAETQVDGFCKALRAKLFDKASNFGKEYLKLLVDEIEVQQRRVCIRGSYSSLAQAVNKTKLGKPEWVPNFGGVWLPEQDSLRFTQGKLTCDLVVNPASGGTLPVEIFQKASDTPSLNAFF